MRQGRSAVHSRRYGPAWPQGHLLKKVAPETNRRRESMAPPAFPLLFGGLSTAHD
jgi:hypothetical protein